MIVTSFTLRSPCSWKLQCEMYVLQFYLNLFSVVLAQLRLTLRCRCIDASTSTPPQLSTFTSSCHTLTSADLPLHLTTPTHLRIYISHLYIHTVAPSHLSCLSFFRSFYLSFFSSLCIYIFARSHPPPPYIHRSISRLHIHTVTPSHPPSLSLFLYIFSTLDNCMSRSRANRRLVTRSFFVTTSKAPVTSSDALVTNSEPCYY